MILENGTVLTGDPRLPRSRAIAIAEAVVAGGVDVREGDRSQVSVERVDLDGRCVVPGFADAHVHFLEWSLALRRLDVTGTRSLGEVLDRVRTAAAEGGGWLLGRGWRQSHWPAGEEPTREALDEACAGRPCALYAHDGHSLWLSTGALDAVGLPDVPIVERRPDGTPTGILREDASYDFWEGIPMPPEGERDEIVRAAILQAYRRGVTAVHDFQRSDGLGSWQRLHRDRRLGLRVWASIPAARLDEALDLQLRSGFGDEWLQIGPVKAFADGTLGSRTAAMLEPFADDGTGVALLGRDELADLVRRASAGGLEVAVHAIGDAANRTVLDALEQTRQAWQPAGRRPRVEHTQLLHPDDVGRFAALGVTASVQPTHATSDVEVARAAWGERCATAYAYGPLLRSGAPLCFGSDAPIEPLDPLAAVAAAVNHPLGPDHAVPVADALAACWGGAAYARHDERRSGRLLPGYHADLCVLDRDPTTCPPDQIGQIEVVATMVGGRWVHGRPPW